MSTVCRTTAVSDTTLVCCCGTLGLFSNPDVIHVQQSIAAELNQREQAIRQGQDGTRYDTAQKRLQDYEQRLAQAEADLAKAEADHFAALGGTSDTAIESARTAVIQASERFKQARADVDSMRHIVLHARAALGMAFRSDLPSAFADLKSDATQRRDTALAAIRQALDSGLLDHFRDLASAALELDTIGTDSHALECSCRQNNLSDVYSTLLPINHVSLQIPEIQTLSQKEIEGLRVRV